MDLKLKFNSDGLIPAIAQDYKTGLQRPQRWIYQQTGEVLMLAYMDQEAFDLTVKTGKGTYFSRSRQSLWVKGETSGHFQYVKEIRYDCDCDTILLLIDQIGAACHTGNRSCFYRKVEDFKGGEE